VGSGGGGGGSRHWLRQSLIGFERIDYFAVDGFAAWRVFLWRMDEELVSMATSGERHQGAVFRRLRQINLRSVLTLSRIEGNVIMQYFS